MPAWAMARVSACSMTNMPVPTPTQAKSTDPETPAGIPVPVIAIECWTGFLGIELRRLYSNPPARVNAFPDFPS